MAETTDTLWLPVLPSMKGFGPALASEAAKDADKAGKSTGARFGKAMVVGVAAVGVAGLAAGTALYKVGEVFDDVTDTIRVGSGASGKALDDLVGSAKNIGKKVPADFDKIGSTVADVSTRMGLTGEAMETVASQYLEAGRILGEDIDVGKTSAAFNAFKIEGDNVSGAMDHLFQVSQATGVGMNELAAATSANAPAMQTLGFSFEETTSMIGSFDKAGLNSSAMMAAMSKGMVTLAKDGEEPAEAFKRVQGEIGGFIEKGDEAGALNLASKVFGTRGASQFVGAVKSGAISLDDMTKAGGQTGDTILGLGEETMDFAEQWQMFKNNVLVWLEPMGARVFGALGTLMGEVTTGVQMFGDAWSKNDGTMTASGIPGMLERLGYYARQTFDYVKTTVIPTMQGLAGWLNSNKTTIGVVAGVITALLLPAFVRWAAGATVAKVQTMTAFLVTKAEAIKAAGVYAVQSVRIVGSWFAMGAAALKSAAQTVYVWALYKIEAAKAVAAMVLTRVKIAAQWGLMAASAVASGIKTALVWTGTIIRQAALGAIQFMLSAGKIVAGWVLMGLQSMLQAARMAAAWLIAMGPIGWAIAAIVGIAAIVIANWSKIKKFTIDTWNSVSGKIKDVWNNNIKPVFQAFGNFIENNVKPAFKRGVDGIKKIWDTVKSIAYKPVDFVVNTVYNNGLRSMVNSMSSKLGLKWELPKVNIPAFAKGGQMGKGWKLVGEEGPELINTGPGYVYTANETKRMLDGKKQMPLDAVDQGQQSHKGIGGFWGDLWGGVKNTVGKVKDWAVGMLAAGVRAVTDPLKNSISSMLPGGGFNELIRGAGFKVLDGLTGWATKKDGEAGGGEGGSFGGGYDGPLGRFFRPNGRITSGFGSSRGAYPHAGIDFAVPIGTAVKAMFDGVIRKNGWNAVTGRSGKGQIIDHGQGYSSYTGHLSGWTKQPGERVKAGETTALSGNTGRSTGPHAHRELWKNGKPFNFMSYLHDNGGVLNTGLSMIMNNTRKPEAIYNHQQNANLQTLAKHAAQNLAQPSSTDAEAMRYALHGMEIKMQTESGTVFAKLVNKGVNDLTRGKKSILS